MHRLIIAAICGLILSASGYAQALAAVASNDGTMTTITASFPAASLSDDAFPLFALPEGQAIAGRTRLLVLPLDSLIRDYEGRMQDIDAVTLAISRAMAYDATQSGQEPPAFISGVRIKVQQKLAEEYQRAMSVYTAHVERTATPAEVAAGIPDVP